MDIATSQVVSQTFSSWADNDGFWSSFLLHVGAPATAQIASAITISCYDPEHRWKTRRGSLGLGHQSISHFSSGAEQPFPFLGHEISDIEDLTRLEGMYDSSIAKLSIVPFNIAWTQSYCRSLPVPLHDILPSTYAVAFTAFALAVIYLYEGLSVNWRKKTLPVLALGAVAATVASIATTETRSLHSIVWLVSPVTTAILVSGAIIDGIRSRRYRGRQDSVTKNENMDQWVEKR